MTSHPTTKQALATTSQNELLAILYHLVGLHRNGQAPRSATHMFVGANGDRALQRLPIRFIEDLDAFNSDRTTWLRGGAISEAGRRHLLDLTLHIRSGAYGALPERLDVPASSQLPFEPLPIP